MRDPSKCDILSFPLHVLVVRVASFSWRFLVEMHESNLYHAIPVIAKWSGGYTFSQCDLFQNKALCLRPGCWDFTDNDSGVVYGVDVQTIIVSAWLKRSLLLLKTPDMLYRFDNIPQYLYDTRDRKFTTNICRNPGSRM